ncbi:MAG: HlyC/CorC family transporter [Phycisphaerales bacterium]|nr:HlyC/CorC family transporter [Phycisphaerales bacterium]
MAALAVLLLLILINGVLALAEIAIISSKKILLRQEAEAGNSRAAAALALAENPNLVLSTTQTGITLVAILSGMVGEAALADDLQRAIEPIELIKPYSHLTASIITVVGITYLSLLLGELVPKRFAIAHPERIAKFMAMPMTLLSKATHPIVVLLSLSTNLVLKPFSRLIAAGQAVTEDEVRGIIQQAAEQGVLQVAEHQLVERVLRLGDQQVRNLMVPRTEIEWLDADAGIEQIKVAVATSVHSHFPVCRGSLDDIVGVVHVKDLIRHALVSDNIRVGDIARVPLYIPEATQAIKLPDRFRQAGTRFGFVVDEYGGVEGVITLNDVLEALIGEAATPETVRDTLAVQRADGSWLLDGGLPIDQLKSLTGLDELPKEDAGEYTTLAGMVMAVLGHIPRTGELFQWQDWRIEVIDLDGPKIDKVLASRVSPPEAEDLSEA